MLALGNVEADRAREARADDAATQNEILVSLRALATD